MGRYNPHLIKARHSYSVEEIAALLGISRKTCLRWLQEGLKPIEPNTKPLLIWGNDLRLFLAEKKKQKKVVLKSKEFYCMRCHQAVKAKAHTERTIPTGKKIGRDARDQFYLIGKCNQCSTKLMRFL